MIKLLILIFGLAACNSQTQEAQVQVEPSFKVVEKEEGRLMQVDFTNHDQAAFESILAQADKMDGAEDHQVHKCAGCNLNMDGNKSHAIQVAGYELHHCSTDCRSRFLEDPGTKILALQSRFSIN